METIRPRQGKCRRGLGIKLLRSKTCSKNGQDVAGGHRGLQRALWPYGDNQLKRLVGTGFHPLDKEGSRELALVEVHKGCHMGMRGRSVDNSGRVSDFTFLTWGVRFQQRESLVVGRGNRVCPLLSSSSGNIVCRQTDRRGESPHPVTSEQRVGGNRVGGRSLWCFYSFSVYQTRVNA